MFDLGRTLLQSVERSPRRTAIVDGARRFTYAEWAQAVGAVQRGLAAAGLKRGDHLLVVLQNRWEMAALHWACQFAGIVVTPLNWRAKADEIDYCLADSGARAAVRSCSSRTGRLIARPAAPSRSPWPAPKTCR
jgi:2-furoate---CoA ligase